MIINKLIEQKDLTDKESEEIMDQIMEGKLTDSQTASFLTALKIKGATTEEITSMIKVIKEKAVKIAPDVKTMVDTCGTGGDDSSTFNISTAVSFVVAGAGIPVAKHGNRSASSKSGSADVLEAFGVNIMCSSELTKKNIEKIGIGFMYAPLYHPSFRHVGKVRKELGFKTIFNFLGPLCNPADVKRQVIGTYDTKLTETIAIVLKNAGSEHVLAVHGNGLDELTLTGNTTITELKNNLIESYEISPDMFGLSKCSLDELKGGTAKENAEIIKDALNGKIGPKRDIVLLNAGAAIYVSGKVNSIKQGIFLAKDSIDSGKALLKLNQLIEESNN
ncbi:MAG: anthranilate phosphoribosyltransferase [Nanoarchaeota archaeon]|nr:anthranilate phosphoribosyltransferase [Nanoarchaeota archaeon]